MRQFLEVKDAPSDTKLPRRGTRYSAGYDIYAPCDIFVPAGGISEPVWLNIKAKMRPYEWLELRNRSGLMNKHFISLYGSCVIDSDYFGNPSNDGNIGVRFKNDSNKDYIIQKGERCCQGIFQKYYVTVDDEALQEERSGGFGSTGKR